MESGWKGIRDRETGRRHGEGGSKPEGQVSLTEARDLCNVNHVGAVRGGPITLDLRGHG